MHTVEIVAKADIASRSPRRLRHARDVQQVLTQRESRDLVANLVD